MMRVRTRPGKDVLGSPSTAAGRLPWGAAPSSSCPSEPACSGRACVSAGENALPARSGLDVCCARDQRNLAASARRASSQLAYAFSLSFASCLWRVSPLRSWHLLLRCIALGEFPLERRRVHHKNPQLCLWDFNVRARGRASVSLRTTCILISKWQARPRHAAACLPRRVGTVAENPVRRAQPPLVTSTSGTNNTAPENHRFDQRARHSKATRNRGRTPRQNLGTPANRQKRLTLLAFRFPRFHRLCFATGTQRLSCAAFLLRTKSSLSALGIRMFAK